MGGKISQPAPLRDLTFRHCWLPLPTSNPAQHLGNADSSWLHIELET